MNLAQRPGDHECFDYHRDYVSKVPDGDIMKRLRDQHVSIPKFIRDIAADQVEVIHPPYGWSIRTVVQHCLDAERVFGYRALRISTGDKTDLPGWDEGHYASCGYSQPVPMADLAGEYENLRGGNLALLTRLQHKSWDEIGTADGRKVSTRTLAWLMAGHWLHHEQILRKRLGLSPSYAATS